MKKRYRIVRTPGLSGPYYTVQQREWFWWVDMSIAGSEKAERELLDLFSVRDRDRQSVLYDTAWNHGDMY